MLSCGLGEGGRSSSAGSGWVLLAGDFVGDLVLRLLKLVWVRRVGVGGATGVFARGFARGVMGARITGVEGVLWRRVLTPGRDDDGDGWGRRDISGENNTNRKGQYGRLQWRINQGCLTWTTRDNLARYRLCAVAPIIERRDPGEPQNSLLGAHSTWHIEAPMLIHNSGCPKTPYRSRSDFKTNRKAPLPLHANVSILSCPFDLSGRHCEGPRAIGGQDEAGLAGGQLDDGNLDLGLGLGRRTDYLSSSRRKCDNSFAVSALGFYMHDLPIIQTSFSPASDPQTPVRPA